MGILHINKTLYGSLPNFSSWNSSILDVGGNISQLVYLPPPHPPKKNNNQTTKKLEQWQILKLLSSATLVNMIKIS